MTKTIQIPVEYKRLFDRDWREAAVYGGRYSLKSHTVARLVLIRARQEKTRVACFREFQNSISESSYQLLTDLIKQYELKEFNCTNNSIVNTLNGSDFIFKGLWNNEQSIKSIEGIDIAWVEEAQTISEKSLEVLTPTVRKEGSQIIYTYNRLLEDDPVHKRLVIEGRPNTLIINTNYEIALKYKMMPDVILQEVLDDQAKRPALFKHKWLGEPSNLERKIYKDWAYLDEIPHEARLERYGLDFGYTNDPTAIVAVYKYNDGYIFDEIAFQKGLSNKQIADILLNQPLALVVADSAEPKSIDELKLYGVNIIGASKGQGSVSQGIQYVQDQRCSVTKSSINVIKEFRNYLFIVDNNGVITNQPESGFDHCFSPDSLVHTTKGKIRIESLVGKTGYLYSRNGSIQRFSNVRPTRYNAEILNIEFDDGDILSVTPDHLLLRPDGLWVEASLLSPEDRIQSVMYGLSNSRISGENIQTLSWRKVFQSWAQKTASCCLGVSQWLNPKGLPHSPQRPQCSQQLSRKSGVKAQSRTSKRTYDFGTKIETGRVGRKDKTTNKEVALIRRGKKVAQVTWTTSLQEEKTCLQKLLSLSSRIFNNTVFKVCQILPPELQNESQTKKVVRITRGRSPVTYNLEVENTECLLVNGVIAHNSMDAIRYALETIRPSTPYTFIEEDYIPRYNDIGI